MKSALASESPVPPHAARGVVLYLPDAVVDLASTPAIFDVEARRGAQIKGHHVIIRVTAQSPRDGNALILTEVKGSADVIERLCLEHEMIQPFWRIRHRVKRNRV